jgi:hypothetical protein
LKWIVPDPHYVREVQLMEENVFRVNFPSKNELVRISCNSIMNCEIMTGSSPSLLDQYDLKVPLRVRNAQRGGDHDVGA